MDLAEPINLVTAVASRREESVVDAPGSYRDRATAIEPRNLAGTTRVPSRPNGLTPRAGRTAMFTLAVNH
jgi:hypothetical protein